MKRIIGKIMVILWIAFTLSVLIFLLYSGYQFPEYNEKTLSGGIISLFLLFSFCIYIGWIIFGMYLYSRVDYDD